MDSLDIYYVQKISTLSEENTFHLHAFIHIAQVKVFPWPSDDHTVRPCDMVFAL